MSQRLSTGLCVQISVKFTISQILTMLIESHFSVDFLVLASPIKIKVKLSLARSHTEIMFIALATHLKVMLLIARTYIEIEIGVSFTVFATTIHFPTLTHEFFCPFIVIMALVAQIFFLRIGIFFTSGLKIGVKVNGFHLQFIDGLLSIYGIALAVEQTLQIRTLCLMLHGPHIELMACIRLLHGQFRIKTQFFKTGADQCLMADHIVKLAAFELSVGYAFFNCLTLIFINEFLCGEFVENFLRLIASGLFVSITRYLCQAIFQSVLLHELIKFIFTQQFIFIQFSCFSLKSEVFLITVKIKIILFMQSLRFLTHFKVCKTIAEFRLAHIIFRFFLCLSKLTLLLAQTLKLFIACR